MIRNEYLTTTHRNYKIEIFYDDCAESPRGWSNVCTLNCYHRRYNLGDNSSQGDPWEDLRRIIIDNISPDEFIRLANKHCKSIRITHNNRYCLLYDIEDKTGKPYGTFDISDRRTPETLKEWAVELMADSELFTVIDHSSTVAISNVYGYDHGGLTISLSRFSCPWDSGCLGFIYVTKETILGVGWPDVNEDNWKDKAYEVMAEEVDVYDSYLRGECFGWSVYAPCEFDEDGEPTDWEFFSEETVCGYVGTNEIDHMMTEARLTIDSLADEAEAQKELNAAAE